MDGHVVLDSGEWTHFPGQSQMSIDFDDLNPKDKVVIRTRNSSYRFLITDPAKRRGVLTGGALGNNTLDAVLIESFAQESNAKRETSYDLKTGARVLFYLYSTKGAERIATSVIQELVVIRTEQEVPKVV
ncbi:MAG: hypothetical protein WAU45_01765 [Blastocatellia bacterium]